MNKIKIILIVLVTLVASLNALPEKAGEYGFQVLNISSSPAMSGMGDTGAFSTDDALNFMSNPAAGLFNKSRIITVSQNFWIADTDLIAGGYSINKRKYHWGYAFKHLNYGTLDQRDEAGQLIGEYSPLDFVGTINYAYRFGATHFIGINANLLYEKIHTASSVGLSTDLGYVWNTPLKDLKLYTALKNLGTTSKMDKENIDLPITYEIGLAKEFISRYYDLAFDVQAHKAQDTDFAYNFGVQLKTFEILYLRSGYKENNDSNEFSYGVGIDFDSFNVDYAYLPMTNGFDNVHKISLSYKF
ncbi:PorV/PorQ family protein [bacterium]|nr:PorV/PorQ family protein [bacterium]